MKLIAIALAGLFLASSAIPASAGTYSRATGKTTTGVTYTLKAAIPGANSCC